MQPADFILEATKLGCNLLKLVRFFEISRTAVRRIEAGQIKVPTPLAWGFAVTFYLAPLTLIAIDC
jgi:hypothetical protein